jgi:hypothetical protein
MNRERSSPSSISVYAGSRSITTSRCFTSLATASAREAQASYASTQPPCSSHLTAAACSLQPLVASINSCLPCVTPQQRMAGSVGNTRSRRTIAALLSHLRSEFARRRWTEAGYGRSLTLVRDFFRTFPDNVVPCGATHNRERKQKLRCLRTGKRRSTVSP